MILKPKLIRITTVSESLNTLLKGQLKYLNNYYEVIGVASGAELMREISKREGVRTISIAIRREISLFSDLISLYRLISLFVKEKPYIVHANTPKGSLLGMLAARICCVPIRIYTVTGLRFETTVGFYRKVLIFMEKVTCACATKVIPEGLGVMRTLLHEDITFKPLEVILNGNINGVDVSYFDPSQFSEIQKVELRTKLNINEEDFVFIFVGRLVRDKGINELIQAFDKLVITIQNFELQSITKMPKLLLVGTLEQNLDPLLPSTIETINSNHNIISVGYQNDVRPYYSISDCLAFPSYREGFPNVVLQAGAMGLPCIVTDINGCNEIIVQGKNGYIIPSKSADELYQTMNFLIGAEHIITEMTRNARDMIISRYEQSAVWNALLNEYRKLENCV